MTVTTSLREYAPEQMQRLLTRLIFQIHRAAKMPGPDEIHDVRVCLRRFSQGLTLFGDLFPLREIKKIKRRLKHMLKLTSQIRDRDIALEFLAGLKETPHRERLLARRLALETEFAEMVRRWNTREFSAKWRGDLALPNT